MDHVSVVVFTLALIGGTGLVAWALNEAGEFLYRRCCRWRTRRFLAAQADLRRARPSGSVPGDRRSETVRVPPVRPADDRLHALDITGTRRAR